jgi:hypothetical protein
MAYRHHAHRGSDTVESELWYNMPSSTRHQQQQESSHASEQSAYRATTHRLSTGSTSAATSRAFTEIPSIHTTMDTNKPLPPSPTESEKKKRKPAYLRSLLGRSSSSHLDPNYLHPQPHPSSHRLSATSTNLSLDTDSSYYHAHSRSMPSSPYESNRATPSLQSGAVPRATSADIILRDSTNYQPYTPPSQQLTDAANLPMNTYFETTPPRARTFPTGTNVASPTLREGVSNRPRPHTWLSPTDSFSDASQFSLFVQATTGLPEDNDPFSPTGRPQLQGSLFARRSQNDTIPLPFQNSRSTSSRRPDPWTDWQNFEPPQFSRQAATEQSYNPPQLQQPHSFQSTPHMVQVNRELEILGLDDDDAPDDELPNYAQSQAEAHERRRAEASARARELEARWRNTRGR